MIIRRVIELAIQHHRETKSSTIRVGFANDPITREGEIILFQEVPFNTKDYVMPAILRRLADRIEKEVVDRPLPSKDG